MGCIVEFDDVRFDFIQNKSKQKTWIEALLSFTNIEVNHLAGMLEIPVELLIQVRQGEVYFSQEIAEQLGRLFIIAFSD
jgi:hypothetical protein